MTATFWFLVLGGLLLARGLTPALLQRSPVTSAIVYLAVGVLVGPTVLNLFHFNPLKESALLEVLTEIAVLISLFSAGVKMPAPISLSRWRAPVLLASVGVVGTVGLVTAFAYYVLDLPMGAGVLLGAIVAPTDPVLATDVQTRHPDDHDKLRFTLTCEAGMNDGSAFPFVMLGLGLLGLGDLGSTWLLRDVLWATLGGIALGIVAGILLAQISLYVRRNRPEQPLLNDFLGLGLIGFVYGLSLLLHVWGFLAVFFAAVALRQTEARQTSKAPPPMDDKTHAVTQASATVSHGALIFKEHLERLSELALVLLIGGSLFVSSWSWQAVGFALFLFIVARPVSVYLSLLGTGMSWRLRGLTAWFGVRGIGSLYYLMFAIGRGLPEDLALELMQITLVVVTLSIVVHGTSVKPLISRFWNRNNVHQA